VRRTALLLGCDTAVGSNLVYGQTGSPGQPPILVGPACRLCERKGCLSRAEPPVTRPLGLDEMTTGLSIFDF
jgi:predicted transcriptional regulator